jgi:hypothetical protein
VLANVLGDGNRGELVAGVCAFYNSISFFLKERFVCDVMMYFVEIWLTE